MRSEKSSYLLGIRVWLSRDTEASLRNTCRIALVENGAHILEDVEEGCLCVVRNFEDVSFRPFSFEGFPFRRILGRYLLGALF